jgi:hypothetical protein
MEERSREVIDAGSEDAGSTQARIAPVGSELG